MKIEIKHLLLYRWERPSIGVRIKSHWIDRGIIIPIPQWFSSLMIWVQNLYKKETP